VKRPISPKRLVRLARDLAGVDAGPGQPRNVNLRRAVSTAYYGLFHRLALDVARNALPGATDDEIRGVARYISHTAIKEVCEWIGDKGTKKHLGPVVERLRRDPDVTLVAQAFLRLHEQREAPDYDHGADLRYRCISYDVDAHITEDIDWPRPVAERRSAETRHPATTTYGGRPRLGSARVSGTPL
jgi:hypothetical protein